VFILGSKIEELRTIKFKRSKYPSRRGQVQYSWEPPRVIKLDNASYKRLSRENFETAVADQKRWKKKNGYNASASASFNELHGQIKSAMGRCVNGSTNRVDDGELYESFDNIADELRLLGNGVVPDTAARAFEVLWNRLNETRIH
jgi:hypothetical protein